MRRDVNSITLSLTSFIRITGDRDSASHTLPGILFSTSSHFFWLLFLSKSPDSVSQSFIPNPAVSLSHPLPHQHVFLQGPCLPLTRFFCSPPPGQLSISLCASVSPYLSTCLSLFLSTTVFSSESSTGPFRGALPSKREQKSSHC